MAVVTITDAAADHARKLLATKPDAIGIKLGTETYGCSGMGYKVEYVLTEDPADEVVEDKGIKLFVDRRALLHILGTVVDFEDTKFARGFKFTNPNETGRCGCGESFTTGAQT